MAIDFEKLLDQIQPLYNKLQMSSNVEKYYANFRVNIVDKAEEFFDSKNYVPGLVCVKLCDIIFVEFKKQQQLSKEDVAPKTITATEVDGIQYLAGYVVRKLLKKATKSKGENSDFANILVSVLTNANDQTLINIQTRGGLTAVNRECQLIFFKSEEIFRAETKGSVRKICVESIVETVTKNVDVVSSFTSIVENAVSVLDANLSEILLSSMVKLYIRVRAYSLSRDLIQKHRQNLKSKAKHGLRKTL